MGWPPTANAQQPDKLPTIGFLGTATASAWRPYIAAFEQRLRELGWVEGRSGVLPHVIEAVLNHISGHRKGVAGIYNRAAYGAEKRAALDTLASYIKTAVAQSESGNVRRLKRA